MCPIIRRGQGRFVLLHAIRQQVHRDARGPLAVLIVAVVPALGDGHAGLLRHVGVGDGEAACHAARDLHGVTFHRFFGDGIDDFLPILILVQAGEGVCPIIRRRQGRIVLLLAIRQQIHLDALGLLAVLVVVVLPYLGDGNIDRGQVVGEGGDGRFGNLVPGFARLHGHGDKVLPSRFAAFRGQLHVPGHRLGDGIIACRQTGDLIETVFIRRKRFLIQHGPCGGAVFKRDRDGMADAPVFTGALDFKGIGAVRKLADAVSRAVHRHLLFELQGALLLVCKGHEGILLAGDRPLPAGSIFAIDRDIRLKLAMIGLDDPEFGARREARGRLLLPVDQLEGGDALIEVHVPVFPVDRSIHISSIVEDGHVELVFPGQVFLLCAFDSLADHQALQRFVLDLEGIVEVVLVIRAVIVDIIDIIRQRIIVHYVLILITLLGLYLLQDVLRVIEDLILLAADGQYAVLI